MAAGCFQALAGWLGLAQGCKVSQDAHLSTLPPHAAAIYERMGYGHTESSYTKLLETAAPALVA